MVHWMERLPVVRFFSGPSADSKAGGRPGFMDESVLRANGEYHV